MHTKAKGEVRNDKNANQIEMKGSEYNGDVYAEHKRSRKKEITRMESNMLHHSR
jgi:hypothetical protein